MERNSFVFYQSFYEAIKELPRDVQGDVLTAIVEYGLYGETTEQLKPIARGMLALVKPQIDSNNQRFVNGCKGAEFGKKGGRPVKKENPKETPKKPQENPKETPNVYVDVDVNDKDILFPFSPKRKKESTPTPPEISEVEAYFDSEGYSEEAAKRFFDYYRELEWNDSNGRPVKNWKLKARMVWFRDEHRKQKKNSKWGLSL